MTTNAYAYARANLIGEHTDYNNGFVLPTPIPFKTEVTIEPLPTEADGTIRVTSKAFNETIDCKIGQAPTDGWADYIMGCCTVLKEKGIEVPPVHLTLDTSIPMGAGISSSAALLVAVLRAFNTHLGLSLSALDIARLAHNAEKHYVGVPCGIMDQFVCALGQLNHAFMLDTLHQTFEQVALPDSVVVMLVNCGKKHRLAAGDGYRTRVAECQEACKELGIDSLRDLTTSDLPLLDKLPDLLKKRARHVITENKRVLDAVEALKKGDMGKMSQLMSDSHDSQRDDYEVSIPEIDSLVESSRHFGIKSARLTGGGFGGSIVALVPKEKCSSWWAAISKENPEASLISTYGV